VTICGQDKYPVEENKENFQEESSDTKTDFAVLTAGKDNNFFNEYLSCYWFLQ